MKNYNSQTGLKILLAALCMFAVSKTANAQTDKKDNVADINYNITLNPTKITKTTFVYRPENLKQDSIDIKKQLTEVTSVHDSIILECGKSLRIINQYMNGKNLDFAQITELEYLLNRLTEMGNQIGNLQNRKKELAKQFDNICAQLHKFRTENSLTR